MERMDSAEKNLELSSEFTRYLFEHPDVEEKLPKEAQVVFLPEYDNELREFNLKIAKECLKKGQPIVYVKIKRLAPPRMSRLIETEIELVN